MQTVLNLWNQNKIEVTKALGVQKVRSSNQFGVSSLSQKVDKKSGKKSRKKVEKKVGKKVEKKVGKKVEKQNAFNTSGDWAPYPRIRCARDFQLASLYVLLTSQLISWEMVSTRTLFSCNVWKNSCFPGSSCNNPTHGTSSLDGLLEKTSAILYYNIYLYKVGDHHDNSAAPLSLITAAMINFNECRMEF